MDNGGKMYKRFFEATVSDIQTVANNFFHSELYCWRSLFGIEVTKWSIYLINSFHNYLPLEPVSIEALTNQSFNLLGVLKIKKNKFYIVFCFTDSISGCFYV